MKAKYPPFAAIGLIEAEPGKRAVSVKFQFTLT